MHSPFTLFAVWMVRVYTGFLAPVLRFLLSETVQEQFLGSPLRSLAAVPVCSQKPAWRLASIYSGISRGARVGNEARGAQMGSNDHTRWWEVQESTKRWRSGI